MKAIVKSSPRKGFCLVDLEEPKLEGKLDIKLQILYSGICGTDLHIYDWDEWAQKNFKLGNVCGHEAIGRVVAIGEDVDDFQVGDTVGLESHVFDDRCVFCKNKARRICSNLKLIGVSYPGIWAEFVVVPSRIAFKFDGKVPYKYCALIEPFGNAFHVQSVSEIRGKNVLIIGDGPIGVLAGLIVRTRKPNRLFIAGINPERGKIIEDCDLTFINSRNQDLEEEIQKRTKGEGIDVILELSGSEAALNQAVKIINPLGDINVLSIYPKQKISVLFNDLILKNVKIQTIFGRKIWETWIQGYELLKLKKISEKHLDKVISHQVSFVDFARGIDLLKKKKALKVQLVFSTKKIEK